MNKNIKNKHILKRKEIRLLFNHIKNKFLIDINENHIKVESGFFENRKIIFIDEEPCFMIIDGEIFFILYGILRFKPQHKYVIVDMGAVEYITNGADLMAPGIIDADEEIQKDEHVWICDEKYNKPLATGIALMDGIKMVNEKKGKSVKIIHYVGDKYWNIKINL